MHKEFTPKFLKLDITKTKLTSAAGLAPGTLIEAFDVSPLSEEFKKSFTRPKQQPLAGVLTED